jgi:AAA family ATP:ADP antiporter
MRIADVPPHLRRQSDPPPHATVRSLRDHPFLLHVALVVFLSTATLLAVDYLFKSTVARTLPSANVGPFVARYYLALNGLSLLVQLFVGSPLVRRVGIAAAVVLTPVLLFFGASGAVMFGGAMWAVLLTKTFDGGLRHSIHRITGELIYLPVSVRVRERMKPLIDGALVRTAQTVTGATLLALGGTWLLNPRPFALLVATLAIAWVFAAVTMRRPYLNTLRSAISAGFIPIQDNPDPIDLGTQQVGDFAKAQDLRPTHRQQPGLCRAARTMLVVGAWRLGLGSPRAR